MSPRRRIVGPGRAPSRVATTLVVAVAGGHREAEAVDGLEHPLLREGEVEAELRVLVQGAPQADGIGLQVLGFGEQGVGGHGAWYARVPGGLPVLVTRDLRPGNLGRSGLRHPTDRSVGCPDETEYDGLVDLVARRRRSPPRSPPPDQPRVVPARVMPYGRGVSRARPGLDARRRRPRRRRRSTTRFAAPCSSTSSPRTTCPLRAGDRAAVRPRRRLGRVGAPVDGRGRPPLHGDLRLPDEYPRHRPGRARARPAWCRCRRPRCPSPTTPVDGARLPQAAGAGDQGVAPQHRQADRRPGRLRPDESRGLRREPPPPLLPGRHGAAIELDPSGMVQAIERQVAGFAMPGPASPTSTATPRSSPSAGIYDFAVHHDQILVPVVLRQWRIAELTGLDDAGEARDRLLRRSSASGASAAAWPSAARTSCRRPRL